MNEFSHILHAVQRSKPECFTFVYKYENTNRRLRSGAVKHMSESRFTYVYDQGKLRDTVFQIGARHTPSTNDVESFAVILFFERADGTRVEVAKVDNAEHDEGTIHVDRYYRERGADYKDFDVEIADCWEAEEYLTENWEHFARTYLRNHGRRPREQ